MTSAARAALRVAAVSHLLLVEPLGGIRCLPEKLSVIHRHVRNPLGLKPVLCSGPEAGSAGEQHAGRVY